MDEREREIRPAERLTRRLHDLEERNARLVEVLRAVVAEWAEREGDPNWDSIPKAEALLESEDAQH